ncbi:hypothetical protein L218DRAFT_1004571 [Marasmius fiardii PR-910]|nr:hypothetical protein L218DRAFT_1004571 [Marasmius fiardii PR-910]
MNDDRHILPGYRSYGSMQLYMSYDLDLAPLNIASSSNLILDCKATKVLFSLDVQNKPSFAFLKSEYHSLQISHWMVVLTFPFPFNTPYAGECRTTITYLQSFFVFILKKRAPTRLHQHHSSFDVRFSAQKFLVCPARSTEIIRDHEQDISTTVAPVGSIPDAWTVMAHGSQGCMIVVEGSTGSIASMDTNATLILPCDSSNEHPLYSDVSVTDEGLRRFCCRFARRDERIDDIRQ